MADDGHSHAASPHFVADLFVRADGSIGSHHVRECWPRDTLCGWRVCVEQGCDCTLGKDDPEVVACTCPRMVYEHPMMEPAHRVGCPLDDGSLAAVYGTEGAAARS